MKLESKLGKTEYADEKIYNFLSDFNNFKELIPNEKIKNWESTKDECRFNLEGIGNTGLRIIEKIPFKLIKITNIKESKINMFLWIQLKEIKKNDTYVKLTLQLEVNSMISMMIKKPLQKFLDALIDQICSYKYP